MSRLALFPLSMPLVPHQVMELRIFEQRYLSLISDCLKKDERFGVVQIREGREVGLPAQVYQFGVEAKIVDWTQENGLLGISIRGERKFSIESTQIEAKQLMVAEVTWLPNELELDIDERFSGLLDLCNHLRQHPLAVAMKLSEPRYSCELGWQLCQLLPIDLAEKVALLSMSDPEHRLEKLAHYVDRLSNE